MLVPSGRKRGLAAEEYKNESDNETQALFQGRTENQGRGKGGRGKGTGTGPGRGRGERGAKAAKPTQVAKPTQAETRQNKQAKKQSYGLRRSDAEGGGDFAS